MVETEYKQIKYKQIGQVSKSQDCTYMFVLMLFGCLYYNVFIELLWVFHTGRTERNQNIKLGTPGF